MPSDPDPLEVFGRRPPRRAVSFHASQRCLAERSGVPLSRASGTHNESPRRRGTSPERSGASRTEQRLVTRAAAACVSGRAAQAAKLCTFPQGATYILEDLIRHR
jgi:hypothetical protein